MLEHGVISVSAAETDIPAGEIHISAAETSVSGAETKFAAMKQLNSCDIPLAALLLHACARSYASSARIRMVTGYEYGTEAAEAMQQITCCQAMLKNMIQ